MQWEGWRAGIKAGSSPSFRPKVTFNPTFSPGTGRVGRVVLRQQNGQTVMLPWQKNAEVKPPGSPLARRWRFADAQAYAKGVFADPMQREHYRQLGRERK